MSSSASSSSTAGASTTVTRTVSTGTSVPTGSSLQNYTVATPSQVSSLDVDCNNLDNNIQITPRNDQFKAYCGKNMANGNTGNNGYPIVDFIGLYAYNFSDCLTACSNANYFAGDVKVCQAVSFRIDMAYINRDLYANCW